MTKPTLCGEQNLTAANLNSAVALTIPTGFTPDLVILNVIEATQGSGCRLYWTTNGTTPSATVGGVLPAGVYQYWGELGKLKFLNETASGCRLYISYHQF